MKTWADFVPEIIMFVPDCPQFTVENEARQAAIEFFGDTRCWRSSTPVTVIAATVANQADYTVTPPTGLELCGLPAAWLDGEEIGEALPGDLDDLAPGKTGTQHMVMAVDGVTVRLIPPTVTAGRVVKATCAYRPTQASAGIDDDKFFEHLSTIRDLALSRLYRMQGKPWTDTVAAASRESSYNSAALSASTAAGPRRRRRLRVTKQVI